jgi:hypothetical protein
MQFDRCHSGIAINNRFSGLLAALAMNFDFRD